MKDVDYFKLTPQQDELYRLMRIFKLLTIGYKASVSHAERHSRLGDHFAEECQRRTADLFYFTLLDIEDDIDLVQSGLPATYHYQQAFDVRLKKWEKLYGSTDDVVTALGG